MMVIRPGLLWAAGLLEADGSFFVIRSQIRGAWNQAIAIYLKDGLDILWRFKVIFGSGRVRPEGPGHSWRMEGPKSIVAMLELHPFMSSRRQAQIEVCIRQWNARPHYKLPQRREGLSPKLPARLTRAQELEWAAGFLQGDGGFFSEGRQIDGKAYRPYVKGFQVNKEPLSFLLDLFGGSLIRYRQKPPKQYIWHWHVSGTRAIEVLFTVYAHLSQYRKEQCREVVRRWREHKEWTPITHCKKGGHPLSGANLRLRVYHGHVHRYCLACAKEWRDNRAG